MKTQIVLLALIVTAVLLAGCLGGGNNAANATGGNATGGTQGGTVSNASTAASNATTQPAANASGQQPQSAADQLGSLFAGAGQPNYKVTYTFTIGQGSAAMPATMIMYKKGDKQRTDTNMVISGMGTVSSEMFLLDNNTYVCSSYGDQGFTCMKSSSQASPMPSASTLNESASTENIQLLSPTVIAGNPATCFRITSPATADTTASSIDACVSSDGIVLSMSSSAMTLTATAVERGVDDSVFTLPAQVTQTGQ